MIIRDIMNSQQYTEEICKNTFKCKCGHSQFIPLYKKQQLCKWCGMWVFRSKKDEFDYRVKERLNVKNNKRRNG